MTTSHLLLCQCFVSHVNLNVNQYYFLSNGNNNLAPWKTFFLLFIPLASACLSVCPTVLLPTHERLAWPPPVPSRHQLIYQNTWTHLLVCLFVKCSSRPNFWVKGKFRYNTKHSKHFMTFFVICVELCWHHPINETMSNTCFVISADE